LEGLGEAIIFLAVVAIIAVVAVRLGMLIAPRLDRMTEPHDEDDAAHDD
jgi:hypothetical protein